MMGLWHFLFWLSLGLILYPYLIYPLIVRLLARGKKEASFSFDAEYPEVEIVFAAFNEEEVIEQKLKSLFDSDYPKDRLKVHVGSDCSTDGTNTLLTKAQKQYPGLRATLFKHRQGKAQIINQLVAHSDAQVLILTDANIIFTKNTVKALTERLWSNPSIGAVGGVIQYQDISKKGISQQENDYLNFENQLKQAESKLWGLSMGLEGGCYAIRKELFPAIPPLFYMEDFYVTMSLLDRNYQVLWEPRAIVWEDISVSLQEEYKRKVRISIGNFQNLSRFKHLLWKLNSPTTFAFWGHKVLRWFTPFFLLILLVAVTQLSFSSGFYTLMAGLYMSFIGLGLFGILFSQRKSLILLKYPGHFIYMNLALLDGFFTYIKGVKSNAWQPTKRNQK
jgi:cellulose synthase/poly-beta-1,6-N-acetylglucosamine synthase-like glycosyltransferase